MAVTVLSFQTEDMPMSNLAGTVKKQKRFYISGTANATTDYITMSTYFPTLSTVDQAISTTSTDGVLAAGKYVAGSVTPGTTGTFSITGIVTLT